MKIIPILPVTLRADHALGIWIFGCSLFYNRELWASKWVAKGDVQRSAGLCTRSTSANVFSEGYVTSMASLQFLYFALPCYEQWVKWVVYWWGNFMLPLNFSPSKFFQRVTRFLKWFPTFALNQIAKHSTLHSTVPFILHKVVFIRSKVFVWIFIFIFILQFIYYGFFRFILCWKFLIKSNMIFCHFWL